MQRIKIVISTHDIANGVRHSPSDCPIARALRRLYITRRVSVGTTHIYVGKSRWPTPPKVRRFIDNFDRGRPCRPTTLEVCA